MDEKLPLYAKLDEDFELWRIFQSVQPIFLQDLDWNYDPKSSDKNKAASDGLAFEPFHDYFRRDVKDLPGLCPSIRLSRDQLSLCQRWLKRLLDSLEVFVAAGVVKAAAAREPQRQRWIDIPNWKQLMELTGRLFTGATVEAGRRPEGNVAQLPPAEATLESSPASPGITPKYHKLQALGQLFSQQPEKARQWLNVRQPLKRFVEARLAILAVRQGFRNLEPPNIKLDISGTTEAKWDNVKSQTASASLYDFVQYSTSVCRSHQAKLQLHGTLLDSCDETVERDIFLSPCLGNGRPRTAGWHHSRFTWFDEQMADRKDDSCVKDIPPQSYSACTDDGVPTEPRMITNLCKHFSQDDAPSMWNIDFDVNGLYSSTLPQKPPTAGCAPTMPLVALISEKILKGGDNISDIHKAALALSLGRCLLHLLHTGWAQEVWTAEDINFLCQQTDAGKRIYDIHHPYVTCNFSGDSGLSDSDASDSGLGSNTPTSPGLTMTQSQRTLWSFAKLLLNIQTGSMTEINLDDNEEKMKKRIWLEVNMLQWGGRVTEVKSFMQAVLGCVDFTKSLKRYQRGAGNPTESNSGDQNDMRRIFYTEVIWHLEMHLAFHSGGSENIASIDIPLRATKLPRRNVNQVTNDFGKASTSSVKCSFSNNSEDFLRRFAQFHRRFIVPKMTKENRGSRERIRIALLDTGLSDTGSDLQSCIKEVIEYRRSQGFTEYPKARPKDKENPRYPIREQKSFVEGDRSCIDTSSCGHGTQLACLLLKLAPDADLYIARISPDMEFEVTPGVVKAMKWAVGEKVKADIIAMSFGVKSVSDRIDKGLRIFEEAVGISGHTPLVFASASNSGLTTKSRSHPASDSRVICAYALDGVGNDSSGLNPPLASDAPNFGTFGHGIKVKWKNEETYTSGTSYATPVLAAITASYLAWLTHYENQENKLNPKHEYLWRKSYVERVFKAFMNYKKTPEDKMMFIHPENEDGFSFGNHDVKGNAQQALDPEVIEDDAKTDARILMELNHWLDVITS
ncbi:unnamed protein product [Clonostachys solani]|uniref:Peptidase S8/S53 domain-containing protein n=1 Tax=Clonostachys solani TaxID=160281 RepID=A0A9P0EPB5_9HYPO|nr:unnamed protein product [Clonostachys solani]